MLENSRAAHAPTYRGTTRDVPPAEDPIVARARWIVGELFAPQGDRDFAVRYWNGLTELPGAVETPRFTLVIETAGALRSAFLPPSELALTEAFLRGEIGIEGDLEGAMTLARLVAESVARRLRSPARALRVTRELLRLPRSTRAADDGPRTRPARRLAGRLHSRERDAAAVRHHYDVGNDFYALWLDRERVYSCGYFPRGDESIDEAQGAKLDHICRKLRLRPGERLLDIGCGWGGLIRHAVRVYGATALGITLSEQQASYARQRIADEGLGDRCRVELVDYRALRAEPFDKVASIGMIEHVGLRQLRRYFECALRLTRPGGLFLNHGIVSLSDSRPVRLGTRLVQRLWGAGEFSNRYVFPDGELLPLADVIGAAELVGYETRDVESLREHYAATLRHWVRRLEARADEAIALVGETTYRVWRLYMAAAAAKFTTERIGVAQVLLSRADAAGRASLPRSRADLYAAPRSAT